MTRSDSYPVADGALRMRAKRKLPRYLFDYIEGGAGRERCLDDNWRALDAIRLVPRPLMSTKQSDCKITLGGRDVDMPFAIAPTGLNDLIRPGGDLMLMRAARRARVPFIRSGASLTPYEDLCNKGHPPPWFQIYIYDMPSALKSLQQLHEVGCEDLVVTIDMPVGGIRYRDIQNKFCQRPSSRMVIQSMLRPSWLFQMALGQLVPPVKRLVLPDAIASRSLDISFDWSDFQRLRDAWPGRLWAKGLLHPGDGLTAVSAGADGIIVSNHGGRQLDAAPASWRMLPEFRSVLGETYPILADGGVRSGEDIARALVLGASGVLMGRSILWALADAGEHGVYNLLVHLRKQLLVTMRLLGCETVSELRAIRFLE